MTTSWRDRMRKASFRAVEFYVDVGTAVGGRRGVTFEFPKRDTPSDEDLGRRARRWVVSGYIIGLDYDLAAVSLETALNAEGPAPLILPTMGEMSVRCETYSRSERKDQMNMAVFEMTFVEAGQAAHQQVIENTQQNLRTRADQAALMLADQSNVRARSV